MYTLWIRGEDRIALSQEQRKSAGRSRKTLRKQEENEKRNYLACDRPTERVEE